jgi:hypothetical protein
MLNKNAKKWVKALRSGEYNQTTGVLADQDGYCCLGVACNLYQAENDDLEVEKNEKSNAVGRELTYTFDGESGTLPDKVTNWLGLVNEDGSFHEDLQLVSLAELNDNGTPFERIADIIEEQQEQLFHD